MVFHYDVPSIWRLWPSPGYRTSLLMKDMKETALAVCERLDFVEVNSSIPTELNVSSTRIKQEQ